MADWTWTFADVLTGAELAVLPVIGGTVSRQLSAAGAASGLVPLLDPDLRAQNPWAATRARCTELFVERDGRVVWGGLVWARSRAASSWGLKFTGATFESWLAHRLLQADQVTTQQTAAANIAQLVQALQSYPNGNIGLAVQDATGGGARRDRTWAAADAKTALDLIGSYAATQAPIEYTVDVTRNSDGSFAKTLLIGEPQLGRRVASSGVELVYPGGDLLDWSYDEDGTSANNALYASGGSPPAADGSTGGNAPKLTAYVDATMVGSTEYAAGVPRLEASFSASNETSLPALTDQALAQLIGALNTEGKWSGMKVRPDGEFGVGGYSLGDEANLLVTHPAFAEWPGPYTDTVRIVGDALTQGSGTAADSLSWTLGPTGRLASSVTLTSTLTDMLRRLTSLETA